MRISKRLAEFLKKIKVGKIKFEINVHNLEYPESYYQPTKDIREILSVFEHVIKKIKEKYKAYSCEELFKNKFGEELSEVDFIYQDRLEAYSRRNQVTIEQLQEYYAEIRPLREEVCKRISEEVTLAKYLAWNKFGDNSTYILDQMAQYEMMYGNKSKAKMFKKMSDETKKRIKKEERNELINNIKIYMGNYFRKIIKAKIKDEPNINNKNFSGIMFDKKRVLQGLMAVIVGDINPIGREPEYQENWQRSFQLLNKELSKKGIDLNCEDKEVNNKAIGDAWAKLCRDVKNEKILTYYAKTVQEAEKTQGVQQNPEEESTLNKVAVRQQRGVR
jgi:hypothetical protein